MRTKLLTLCVAALGFAATGIAEAGAREAAPLPSSVRVNEIDVRIDAGPRYHHRRSHYYGRSRHSRLVRSVYYRHGHRRVTYRRVYY